MGTMIAKPFYCRNSPEEMTRYAACVAEFLSTDDVSRFVFAVFNPTDHCENDSSLVWWVGSGLDSLHDVLSSHVGAGLRVFPYFGFLDFLQNGLRRSRRCFGILLFFSPNHSRFCAASGFWRGLELGGCSDAAVDGGGAVLCSRGQQHVASTLARSTDSCAR